MASIYVLDTHTLVWYLESSPRLSTPAKKACAEIDTGQSLGVIPSIVLAEVMHLADRRRVPVNVEEILRRIQQSSNFYVASLDLMTILLMIPLKSFELHDRVIVATAKSFEASIITGDEQIRRSNAVPCIW